MEVLVPLITRDREASDGYIVRIQVQIIVILQPTPAIEQVVARAVAIPVAVLARRIVEARLPRTGSARQVRAAPRAMATLR